MGQGISRFARMIWIVLDSVGIGELPDAADYGDVGRDTLGHIARSRPLRLPNLVRLGLANIKPLDHLDSAGEASWKLRQRRHAFARERHDHRALGNGGDLARRRLSRFIRTDFPPALIAEFERQIGRRTLGEQARFRHRNSEGTGRGARAHRISDRVHLRRQRFSDCRA